MIGGPVVTSGPVVTGGLGGLAWPGASRRVGAGMIVGLAVLLVALRVRTKMMFAWRLFLVDAVGVGVLYGATGVLAWRRRPDSPVGPLMVLTGLLWMSADLALSGSRLLFTVGLLGFQTFTASLVHLTLAFPTGLRRRRLDRALVGGGYLAVAAHSLLNATLAPATEQGVRSYLQVGAGVQRPPGFFAVPTLVLLVVQLAALVLVAVRWRRASRPSRRSTGLIVAGAALSTADFVLTNVLGDPHGRVWELVLGVTFAAVPLAFLTALLTGQLRRGGIERLVTGLRDGTAEELRDAVASGLGDPHAQVLYLVDGHYLDADGAGVGLPAANDPQRAVTPLLRHGQPIGAIVHDRAVCDEPRRLQGIAAATALAVDNARLTAEVLVRLSDVQASRSRLVLAGDLARRQVERDLHDGAQQRLVTVSLMLRLARRQAQGGADGLADQLDEAAAELDTALAMRARPRVDPTGAR